MTYDFPTAFSAWGAEECAAMDRVHASGKYTMGAETEAFEAEFALYHGRKHCIAANSGSSANLLAVAALANHPTKPLKRGDKAVVPAIAWSTSYAPLMQHGLDLAIADTDQTWNSPVPPSWALSHLDETSGWLVLGCSILGNPAYLQEWADAAPGWFMVDDCESLGARIDGRTTASYGDIATSSFFYSHQLSAIEGGAVLTDDDELARLCRLLRNHGNAGFTKREASFDESYDFQLFGYNLRPLELHAAIARAQLKKLDGFIAERRRNLAFFWAQVVEAKLPLTMPKFGNADNLSPFGLHFTVESKDVRARLVAALRSQGIDARLPTGGSFLRHKYAAPWAGAQSTPNADRIHDTGLFLGCPPWNAEEPIEKAVKIMRSVL